eukprot:s455_g2.t1
MCRAGDRILELLRQEVEAVLAKRVKPFPIEDNAMLVCPLCPFRGFRSSNPSRLYKHVRNYHDGPRQFCPSGTKQMKLLISIYDNDRLLGREERPDLLQRSATLIRQTVSPALERSINQIDRYIRLVLTSSGPEYWNLTAVLQAPLRRARNIYYSVDFAQMLFQQTLVHAIMAALHTRVHGDAASLLPSHAKDWWPVLEDIFTSSAVVDMEANLLREAIGHKECLCLSIDATLRCCLSVLGQPKRRRSSHAAVQAAFDQESMLRRVPRFKQQYVELNPPRPQPQTPLTPSVNSFIQAKVFTVRGRTNATLIMAACQSDDAQTCAQVLGEGLPAEGLRQVQYVSVDNPSRHYLLTLKTICPNLQLMALDPVHLAAMTCEYASSRRRTGFTRVLRRMLCKFTAVDSTLDAGAWGKFFDGRNSPPLTAAEIRFRNQIEDRSMRQTDAVRLLESLDPTTPFYSRAEWVQTLAAVVSVHRQEADRLAPGPNRRIWQLLHTASAADRSEWYFNNIRLRHSFPRSYLNLLPAGTASNESLHHEINSWFRETQKIHQSSLKMKLRILRHCLGSCEQLLSVECWAVESMDDLFAAFETFRRAVCRITQDRRINKAALDKIEHKDGDSILKFLFDVHSRKKRHRKRTEALLSLLLELESWKEAFRGPQEEPAEEAEEEEEEEEAEEDQRTLSTLWREDVDEKIDAAAARGAIGLLLVRVVAAHNLINADWFSLSDPYVKVKDDPLGHVSFPARLAPTAPGQERLRFALDSVEHGELEV